MKKNPSKVVIFDWDMTLTKAHLHYWCCHYVSSHQAQFDHFLAGKAPLTGTEIDLLWQYLQENHDPGTQLPLLTPAGLASTWKAIFQQLLAEDNVVAIASFSAFLPIQKKYLQEIIGLTQEEIEKMYFAVWLPAHPDSKTTNKNEHIMQILQEAATKTEKKLTLKQVLFFDDDVKNIRAFKEILTQAGIAQSATNAIQLEPGSTQNADIVMAKLQKILTTHL